MFLQDGNTPLHLSCIHGHGSITNLLIKWGADTNTRNLVMKPKAYCGLHVLNTESSPLGWLVIWIHTLGSSQNYICSKAIQAICRK